MRRSLCALIAPPKYTNKVDRMFEYVAGYIDIERHLPATFSLQARDLRFGLGDKPEGRERSHDRRHHPFQPFG